MIPRNNPEVKSFMAHTTEDLKRSKVEINLAPESHVFFPPKYNLACNGYFIIEPLILAVGTGKDFDQWFPVYVHEYNHFRQWKEEDPEFLVGFLDGMETFDMAWEVIQGTREASEEQVQGWIKNAQALEANCERRARDTIITWKLPIDVEEYCQKANSYLHFYDYIVSRKKWYTAGKEPYNVSRVWKEFNSDIDPSFPGNSQYINLFQKYCI